MVTTLAASDSTRKGVVASSPRTKAMMSASKFAFHASSAGSRGTDAEALLT
jgi:hypothetical protein